MGSSAVAVRAEKLSKRFQLGQREVYRTLRDSAAHAAYSLPFIHALYSASRRTSSLRIASPKRCRCYGSVQPKCRSYG